jgi:hypothetical protein
MMALPTPQPCPYRNLNSLASYGDRLMLVAVGDFCSPIWCALAGMFRSRAWLEAEFLALRHQLNALSGSPRTIASSGIGGIDLMESLHAPECLLYSTRYLIHPIGKAPPWRSDGGAPDGQAGWGLAAVPVRIRG